jgi:glycosyltransferase involved in cell wall biosynthesis
MRIALFSDFSLAQITGISNSLKTLMRGLEARGHAVCVVEPAVRGLSKTKETLKHISLPSVGLPGGSEFRFTLPFGIPKDLIDFHPDIIHTQTFGTVGFQAVRVAKKLKLPLIGTEHSKPADYAHYTHLNYRWMREGLKKFAANYYRRCDLVTAPSTDVRDELRAYGVTREIVVVSNPVETKLFRPAEDRAGLKRKFGITKPSVLCFGRLAREKNIGELIEAFAIAVKDGADAELVIIGTGPMESELKARARELGIAGVTRFLGFLKDEELVQAINANDVYLITSRSETQSMTTMQAMACGLPVVAVRCGALPEYVTDGVNGFLFEPGDVTKCAQCLKKVLSDHRMREKFAQESRKTAECYSVESVVNRMEEIYSSAKKTHETGLVK